jgi:exodeoxyribonuclease VII small subunit
MMHLENQSNKHTIFNSYEEALKELQEILDNLENQTISVDEISAYTQRAKLILQYCQEKIRTIEDETEQML